MGRLGVSVANGRVDGGLNPRLGIFIRRGSASVVLTRSSLSRIFCPPLPWPARFAASSCFFFNSGNWAIACSSRCCFSWAARRRAAFCRADNPAAWGRRLQLLLQLLHMPLRFFQQLLQPFFPPKTARPGTH